METTREKGQVVVIGVVLVLGLLVSFILWFQVSQIPLINQEKESEKHQEIEEDFVDFQQDSEEVFKQNDIDKKLFTVRNTVDYDFFVRRDSSIGSISFNTVENPYSFDNAEQSIDGLPQEKDIIKYEPVYTEHSPNNFIYENKFIFEDQGNAQIRLTPTSILDSSDDTEINLFVTEASFDRIQTKNPRFVIEKEKEIEETEITNNAEDRPIDLEIKTLAEQDIWENIVEDNDRITVASYSETDGSNIVTLELEEDTVFTIRTAINSVGR